MIMQMCCVRDAKSESFGTPFAVTSLGVAIRSFDDEVNRSGDENTMNKHSGDFALYHIGTFDNNDGSVVQLSPIKLLVQGNEVKKVVSMSGKVSKV